jgi:hypothetical protein
VLTDWSNLGKLHFLPQRHPHSRKLAIANSQLSFHDFQLLLICQNPINDEEVMSAGTPGTCRKISETATLATSFFII